ncbi:MAG: AAA family ATPase, partial [Patescibacteria group bacterium]
DPGIGKSTLLLQIGLILGGLKKTENAILYVSGEESEDQIKLRAKRISKDITKNNFFVVASNNTNAIVELLAKTKPKLAIIDSIQTMESENLSGLSGSVGQVRYAAALFIRIAKTLGISIIMVGHVTKEGMVAGPMVLSHMVDTVLFFEGDKFTRTRILRSLKNRFGPVDEVGIFTMGNIGITEVKNPEQIFLTESLRRSAGSVITVTLEGTRALPVEIQSLVVFSKLPVPRHVATGVDPKRLEILLAVLQKHCNLPLLTMDVFMNVAGGIKLTDPGADLSICLAIFSSLRNIPLNKIVGIAEVGLLGELRSVPLLEKRAKEARKLGFKNIISSETHKSLKDVLESIGR